MPRRAFTVQQANSLIPALEGTLARIRALREAVRERMDKLQVLDALWGEKVLRPDNPDHSEFLAYRERIASAARDIERIVAEQILARGLRFPAGGLEHGLIDFPTTYDGRWVYLCWQSPESRLVAWHEVDGGFRGRQDLTAEQEQRMGLEDDPEALDDSMLDF